MRRRAACTDDQGKGVNSSAIFAAMNDLVQDDAILAVDVGNNAYSFGRYFESSGAASGANVRLSWDRSALGIPLAWELGRRLRRRRTSAWHQGVRCGSVTGDGGFAQYMMEVLTAVKYNMNLTHVLLHNARTRQDLQRSNAAASSRVWKTSLHNPNFAEYVDQLRWQRDSG